MIQDFLNTHNLNLVQMLIVAIGYLMPIPLAYIALFLWHHYRQERFIMGIKWVLLEIQVPRDVVKSPAAMELIFTNALYHKSIKGFWEQYIQGAPWFWFSLEIASIDGRVHFFIRTPTRMRNLVETQIYGQYPQAKVVEVDDYAFHVPQYKKDGNWNMWGCEFNKLHNDFLPIKTYKSFGDDMKTGVKEEFKIDPITPTIEYLGSIPRGQQVWMQMVVRWSIKTYHSHEQKKHVDFYEAAEEFLHKRLESYTKYSPGMGEGGIDTFEVRAPAFLDPLVKQVEANMEKLHFDCGIRLVALSDKRLCTEDQFQNLRREVRLLFRQYAQPNINELNRINATQFDAPWSDPTGLALTAKKKRMLDWYRMRTFFHPPLQYTIKLPDVLTAFIPAGRPQPFVLSTEELATLFHFPGMVSETPSFKRIESKIAKPPSNLPI
ncbi:hypothetical protein A2467_00735 [Candidatus Nomurabacteria bacterium RIFOXYC2_FULL_36_8]|nr:MAG: hypothetical protein UR97_C0004G0019 [Candidatus Nomurabacteria bacterium GW2011_GWE2_36_115]KKP94150.1 MAG: hypothetical protein US00_C0003G0074 [Candidatus Nomurabacteria bacterium GW2011_GWF2_36_126]KKP96722.1 MAG: hypothetical protein US04_C0001G0224 [Candidatus Nomurabacteria bacterium GW2011_GWD2_36_14]KKP99674.1 MAG: hypothetical protein US08_C0001G0357 [Candidatus Nomurabacteria bacterium GW2011_GWF2_36_19]KKQ05381.1 MAG: hypothetical protein US17_C0005G0148 [Candidatus Nomuraba